LLQSYFPIKLTKLDDEYSKFTHFNSHEVVGHWHNDMPGLTPRSKVIATSLGCPRQIVEYSNVVYGFQCHLEFTSESIAVLIEVSYEEFDDIDNHNYIQKPEYIIAISNLHMNLLLFKFMDKLAVEYRSILTM